MSNITRAIACITAATVSAATLTSPAFAQEATISKINIAAITDFHGHIETVTNKDGSLKEPGAAILACHMPKLADEGAAQIRVSAGDNIGGSTFVSSVDKDVPTIEALNAMGFVASAVGNHEFDQGWKDLSERIGINGDKLAKYTHLGANVEGETPELAPSYVEEVNGVKVGFVGAITDKLPSLVSPAGIEGITATAPIPAINAEADRLVKDGEADIVIALMHEDVALQSDSVLGSFSDNVAAVVGGHSHQFAQKTVEREGALPLVIVQAENYGTAVGDIDIEYDTTKRALTSITGSVQTVDEIAKDTDCVTNPDAELTALVKKAHNKSEVLGQEIVAQNAPEMRRASDDLTAAGAGSSRGSESVLGNFIGEASKNYLAANSPVKPDLGVINAGGIRADIEGGDVTYSEAFLVQPFGNEIGYVEITGAALKDVLEQQWQADGSSRAVLMLGWSKNFSYTYDPAKPRGEKITSMSINGAPVDLNKTYTIAGNTFLLAGGDNFKGFTTGEVKTLGLMDLDAFIYGLKDKETTANPAQIGVGASISGKVKPGETVTLDLSSLDYTVGGTATTVKATLGDASAEAQIDKTTKPEPGQDTFGTAKLTLTVPEGLSGDQRITITTDAGTEATIPVTISAGDDNNAGSGDDSHADATGSSDLADVLIGLSGAIMGLIAAIAAAIGLQTIFNQ